MSDLVKRLRETAEIFDMPLCEEAADAIERKDAAIAELVGALKMYRRAGLGDSTDFELQGPAYLLGHDLIVKYDNPTKETK